MKYVPSQNMNNDSSMNKIYETLMILGTEHWVLSLTLGFIIDMMFP